jgi:hypothetical protein
MRQRFTLLRRAKAFYSQDSTNGHRQSLRTKDEFEARALLQPPGAAPRCLSYGLPAAARLNRKVAPAPWFTSAHNRPPCASMIDRLIASPMPIPCGFVV